MIPPEWLDEAARRLHGQVKRTPLTYDPDLNIYLKWENRQITGSFKIRGAINKVLVLEEWEQQRGLVTASAGNHGQGVAYAGRLVGAPVIVYASSHAVPAKIEAMRALGAEVRLVQGGYEDAERAAQSFAEENGSTWISPYNDGQVIAGQATAMMEMLDQIREHSEPLPGVVVIPVGGGGLISGAALALQELSPRPLLVGIQSTASPFFHSIFHVGSQAGVEELDSLADGLAGAVEEGSLTIPIVRSLVDSFELVSEEEIARATALAWHRYSEVIEGSAAAALAAVLYGKVTARPAAIVISGGNIQPEVHDRICKEARIPGLDRSGEGTAEE